MFNLDYYSSTQGVDSYPELQMQNLWILSFGDYSNNGLQGVANVFPNHDFLIKSTNLPLFSINIEKTDFDLILPQEKENYGSFSFSFYETTKFDGFKWCYNWITDIYDFDARVFKKNFHTKKRSATLRFIKVLNPLSLTELVGINILTSAQIFQTIEFDLKGIMIKGIGDIDLENDSGDPLSFDISLEVQQIVPIQGLERIH
jgi:hypothetical protein